MSLSLTTLQYTATARADVFWSAYINPDFQFIVQWHEYQLQGWVTLQGAAKIKVATGFLRIFQKLERNSNAEFYTST